MTATFYIGDAIEVMGKLPEKSVDLILTSPPFLALRSYLPADHPDKAFEGGSQATPGEYVDWLLDVVEACARVLAPHGSLCFELGDTYSGSGGAGGDYGENGLREGQPTFKVNPGRVARYQRPDHAQSISARPHQDSLPKTGSAWPLAKSLSLIPESFRWAMVYGHNPHTGRQTEPWRLRNVIRWVRPNPPVGALGDKFRPATSELMVFCKAKDRYFDLDAVREPYLHPNHPQVGKDAAGKKRRSTLDGGEFPTRAENPAGAPPLDWWNIPPGGFSGAHYATFPKELLIKPIKAMCPEQVCQTCGEARRRIVENSYEPMTAGGRVRTSDTATKQDPDRRRLEPRAVAADDSGHNAGPSVMAFGRATKNVETLGFTDCGHNDYRPGLVLDPFAGSGTTLVVATGHGRDAIGIDLDERNYELALDRVGPLILELGLLPET